jgi:hypothetical protein
VQQLGRSHRSNEVCGPEYVTVVTDLPGEIRFAATAAKRLGQLGALMQGDRMATVGSEEMQLFDLDTKHGLKALKVFLNCVTGEQAIQDKYLPPHVRESEKPEEEKVRFQALLHENLALVDLATNHTKQTRAPRRGQRADEAEEEGPEGDDGKGPKGVAVQRFFNRLLGK